MDTGDGEGGLTVMKVLVTGGSGFTGSWLVKQLCEKGYDVRTLVRDKKKGMAVLDGYDVEFIEGDITDENTVEKAVKNTEKVFHIAAAFRTAGIKDKTYWDINVGGTEKLLKASLNSNVAKFIHCSTVGVHGNVKNGPANENSPFSPGDIYQETKAAGELKALAFGRENGLPITVIRPCPIYGPGDLRLLKLFKLSSRKIVPVLGAGKIYFQMVYVEDLARAFILASETDRFNGEVFIAGGDDALMLNDLIDLIAEALDNKPVKIHLPATPFHTIGHLCELILIPLGIEPPIFRRRVDFFTKSRLFDISKAREILNFQPEIPVEQGIQLTAEWYRAKGYI
jgi:nucleoside-diphosphate-sugar epimerase